MRLSQLEVKEFNQIFKRKTPTKVSVLSQKDAELCASLILEEALETIEGLGLKAVFSNSTPEFPEQDYSFVKICEQDSVAVADGLADLIFVAHFAAEDAGIDLDPVQAEVSRSNNSKAWKEEELEVAREKGYSIEETTEQSDGRKYIVKNSIGKIVKSPSYSPANIAPIIAAQS